MVSFEQTINYYKRREVQEAILKNSKDREVGIRFQLSDFSRARGQFLRGQTLTTPYEIFEFAKKGASSFHISEERWSNPQMLSTSIDKKLLNDINLGWDLIIDIDFKIWEATKLIAHEIIKVLREHNIKNISCKFSGNKGFHIGVPYESFPEKISFVKNGIIKTEFVKNLYPYATRRIINYLIDIIDPLKEGLPLSQKIINLPQFQEYIKNNPEEKNKIIKKVCSKCGKELKGDIYYEYVCLHCGYSEKSKENLNYKICPKCKRVMKKIIHNNISKCSCGNNKFINKVNLEIDTILISPRHLFRSPYSLHEKSGLISIPIKIDEVLDFKKEFAQPNKINFKNLFLDSEKSSKGEALSLFIDAFDYNIKKSNREDIVTKSDQKTKFDSNKYNSTNKAIPIKFFPKSILNGLNGLKDGRKRFLFILINFLDNVGYSKDEIESIINEWNKKNPEPLSESYIKGQLNYFKNRKIRILPPNYENEAYYKDINILSEDEINSKIKNPVAYTKIMYKRYLQNNKKNKKQFLSNKKTRDKNIKTDKNKK